MQKLPNSPKDPFYEILSVLFTNSPVNDILQSFAQWTRTYMNSNLCSIYLTSELYQQITSKFPPNSPKSLNQALDNQNQLVLSAVYPKKGHLSKLGKMVMLSQIPLAEKVFEYKPTAPTSNRNFWPRFSDFPTNVHPDDPLTLQFSLQPQNQMHFRFFASPVISGNKCVGLIHLMYKTSKLESQNFLIKEFHRIPLLLSAKIDTERRHSENKNVIQTFSEFRVAANKKEKNRAFRKYVNLSQKLLNFSCVQLYHIDKTGTSAVLKASTDPAHEIKIKNGKISFLRSEYVIGWVFKTGKPVLINNLTLKNNQSNISYRDIFVPPLRRKKGKQSYLAKEEREISLFNKYDHQWKVRYKGILAIPILSQGGKPQGVIAAFTAHDRADITETDIEILTGISKNIAAYISNVRRQELKNILIRIGRLHGDDLFKYVVKHVPELVLSPACSIFLRDENFLFTLKYSNSREMKFWDPKKKTFSVKNISYPSGLGKTGIVAELGHILVINHYGREPASLKRLIADRKKYTKKEKFREYNLVSYLKDQDGNQIGLARLIREKNTPNFSKKEKKLFRAFANKTIYIDSTLPCNHSEGLCEKGKVRSFIAAPFTYNHKVYGLMRIPRSFPGGIFAEEDISLVISVANRLSSVIVKERQNRLLVENQSILQKSIQSLSTINTRINSHFKTEDIDQLFDDILLAATDILGFEFACIQLVDESKSNIYTAKAMKNKNIADALDPNQWMMISHALDPPNGVQRDIHAWILRESRKPHIIKGDHPNFDPHIYKKYNHKDLIRAFIPMVTKDPEQLIGTLEVGHNVKRTNSINETELAMLIALANAASIAIANQRFRFSYEKKEKELNISRNRATLGIIASRLVHEISQPFQIILSISDNCKDFISHGQVDLKYLSDEFTKISDNVTRLDHLAKNLYSFAKEKSPKVEQCDINTILKEVIDQYTQRLKSENIIVNWNIDNGLPKVMFDKIQMWMVVSNLVVNSIKALRTNVNKQINIETLNKGDKVVINFSDNGTGMSKKSMKNLFKSSMANTTGESGIGLQLVKETLNYYSGDISCSSKPDKGTQFHIEIPIIVPQGGN